MSEPVSALRNLGPATEREFAKIGITTADQVRALGADEAYRQLLKAGARPHFIGYYVLHMALQGRPCNDCKGAEKAAFRKQFDALVADLDALNDTGFEKILNEIGVGARR
jgi:hypothetical protein